MDNSIYLNKLHMELLSIIDEFDRVCSENDLCYYLAEGTLLGAIRHHGFIPWDDDLDVAMPRKDFDRFIRIAKDTLGSSFELQWSTTNKEYWQVFAKVVKKGTLFKEPGLKKFSPLGIFIDVFPLDSAPSYSRKLERRKTWINHINSVIWFKNSSRLDIRHLPHFILSLFFSTKRLHYLMESIMRSTKKQGTSHYVNFGSMYSLSKQTMPCGWYGGGIRLPFEGRMLNVPVDYLKVLTSIYGSDFMQLPPEEKRRCHYPERVIFSDGQNMVFEKPKHVVTVQEQES